MDNIVGENMRRIRESLGITQEELALRCDLTQAYINFLESGKRGYTRKSLEKISKALGVHISQLFGGEEREKTVVKAAEPSRIYGKQRDYAEIIKLLDKLPDSAVDHYRILLKAEVEIRRRGQA